jgi:hypothetical protein
LASAARSVVTDHVRASMTARRSGDTVSLELFDGKSRQAMIRANRTNEFFETLGGDAAFEWPEVTFMTCGPSGAGIICSNAKPASPRCPK